jgi:hypothetical protein
MKIQNLTLLAALGMISSVSAFARPANGPIIIGDEPNRRGIAVRPNDDQAGQCGGTLRNLARFSLRGNAINDYEIDNAPGAYDSVRFVVIGGHAYLNTAEITFGNGGTELVVMDTPVPRGHRTGWIQLRGASARKIAELTLSASELSHLNQGDPNFTETRVVVQACKVN